MRHRIKAMVFSMVLAGLVVFIYFEGNTIPEPFLMDYYIQNFLTDTFAKNGVAAIYLNYRVFDSIFETLILLISVVAVINFSWRKHDE